MSDFREWWYGKGSKVYSDGIKEKSLVDVLELVFEAGKYTGIAKGIGWTHAEACVSADNGEDIRKKEIPEMLDRAIFDLEQTPKHGPTDI